MTFQSSSFRHCLERLLTPANALLSRQKWQAGIIGFPRRRRGRFVERWVSVGRNLTGPSEKRDQVVLSLDLESVEEVRRVFPAAVASMVRPWPRH